MKPLAVVDIAGLDEQADTRPFCYRDRLGRSQKGLVVCWHGELYAYRNLCPHWSTPLDDRAEEVLDAEGEALVCQTHGARFRPDTGECVDGPCLGESLQNLRVVDAGEQGVEIYPAGLDLGAVGADES